MYGRDVPYVLLTHISPFNARMMPRVLGVYRDEGFEFTTLAILSLIFVFGSYAIAVAPVLMAVALTFLELFVAFLQAFIFALLSSVFIGQMVEAHH